jgi:FlaA1/EpsC-like NDP-sugar epimerase
MNERSKISRLAMAKYQLDSKTRRFAKIVIDLGLIAVSYYAAFWLRFDGQIDAEILALLESSLPMVLTVFGLILMSSGIYKSMWRYSSVRDLVAIVLGNTIGIIVIWVGFLIFSPHLVPRSILLIFWFLIVFMLGGVRLLYTVFMIYWPHFNEPYKRVLIVGAGDSGEMIVRQILHDHELLYKPVGFVDDAIGLRGDRIHQIPVLGDLNSIPHIVKEKKVAEIIIAIPSATAPQMRRAVKLCEEAGVPFRTLPGTKELINGEVSLDKVRKVKIEDLLERTTEVKDTTFFREQYAGKRVLVTGAAGSIGSELCCQLAQLDLDTLILLDRAESDLFNAEYKVRRIQNPRLQLVCIVSDIRNYDRLEKIFQQHQPHMVFHAAAYKHVPLMERFPHEAVLNNIMGTMNVSRAATAIGSDRFVLISTDKAVNPTCVMGATKRVAELYCALQNGDGLKHIVVRFGNVLASKGSVVPLFEQQIRDGGPVTVTSKDIERFFMTIPEAVELVLQAGGLGEGGEIFVLDMGEPIKIYDLARHLIVLSGLEPGVDIPIEITGLRDGEKLFEELWSGEEKPEPTLFPKIMRVTDTLARKHGFSQTAMNNLFEAAVQADQDRIRKHLMEIVPTAKLEGLKG